MTRHELKQWVAYVGLIIYMAAGIWFCFIKEMIR